MLAPRFLCLKLFNRGGVIMRLNPLDVVSYVENTQANNTIVNVRGEDGLYYVLERPSEIDKMLETIYAIERGAK
jgi:hypothetical protein